MAAGAFTARLVHDDPRAWKVSFNDAFGEDVGKALHLRLLATDESEKIVVGDDRSIVAKPGRRDDQCLGNTKGMVARLAEPERPI